MREILQTECQETGKTLDEPLILGWIVPASPEVAQTVLDATPGDIDGRSEWLWLRLANGDLMLATVPARRYLFRHGSRRGAAMIREIISLIAVGALIYGVACLAVATAPVPLPV